MPGFVDYLAVLALGSLVGSGELIARYRDAPLRAITTGAAVFYVAINAVASVAAFGLVRVFGWSFGIQGNAPDAQRWVQVLVAGFSAMHYFDHRYSSYAPAARISAWGQVGFSR